MTLYYFDVIGMAEGRDHIGTDFQTDAEALSYAGRVAFELCSDQFTVMPNGTRVGVVVRHANGNQLFWLSTEIARFDTKVIN